MQVGRQTYRQAERKTGRQEFKQNRRQGTVRQTNRKGDRWVGS
jgi:hypothetical protein